jgi:hypothetical protein
MNALSFNPQYRMNGFGDPFVERGIKTQGERVQKMYNPYMLNRNYVHMKEVRGNLKSEMEQLGKMLDQNLL